MNYNMQDLYEDVRQFNEIAGKSEPGGRADLIKQLKLIKEELQETFDAVDANDVEGMLDGGIDIAVTLFGYLDQLERLGFDVNQAAELTANNNLSKFPLSSDVAADSVLHYSTNEPQNQFSYKYNYQHYCWVITDQNNKVRKPLGYIKNDLKSCLPFTLPDFMKE